MQSLFENVSMLDLNGTFENTLVAWIVKNQFAMWETQVDLWFRKIP